MQTSSVQVVCQIVCQIVKIIQIVFCVGQTVCQLIRRSRHTGRGQGSRRIRPDLIPVRVGVQVEAGAKTGQRLTRGGR